MLRYIDPVDFKDIVPKHFGIGPFIAVTHIEFGYVEMIRKLQEIAKKGDYEEVLAEFGVNMLEYFRDIAPVWTGTLRASPRIDVEADFLGFYIEPSARNPLSGGRPASYVFDVGHITRGEDNLTAHRNDDIDPATATYQQYVEPNLAALDRALAETFEERFY